MSAKIPDSLLTDAQRRRRERNEKYYGRKRALLAEIDPKNKTMANDVIDIKTGKTSEHKTAKAEPRRDPCEDVQQVISELKAFKDYFKGALDLGLADLSASIRLTAENIDSKLGENLHHTEAALASLNSSNIIGGEAKLGHHKAISETNAELTRSLVSSIKSANVKVEEAIAESMRQTQSSLATLTRILTAQKEQECVSQKVDRFKWQDFSCLIASPWAFFLAALILGITGALVVFQTTAYTNSGLGNLALPLAATFELVLLGLTIICATGLYKKTALSLFVAIFVYSMATMNHDLADSAGRETIATITNDDQMEAAQRGLKRAELAFDIAQEKQESGNMSKWQKKIDEYETTISTLTVALKNSSRAALIEDKYYVFVGMRAILMLVNAFFVHVLIALIVGNRGRNTSRIATMGL